MESQQTTLFSSTEQHMMSCLRKCLSYAIVPILLDSAVLESPSDMQHVAPLEQYGVNHVHLTWLQHGQLHQGSHFVLASRRCFLSSPSVSLRVQGVLPKPAKVALLQETMSLVIKESEPHITADLPEQVLTRQHGQSAAIYMSRGRCTTKSVPSTDNAQRHDVSS
jgi:hypothetical protein